MSLKLKLSQNLLLTDKQAKASEELFHQNLNTYGAGFFDLDKNLSWLASCLELLKKYQHKKTFVQIGIGGSALGPQMLIDALGPIYNNEREFLFLDNIDPDYMSYQLKNLQVKDAIFYVVSKSGATAETVAALSIVINKLKKSGVSEKDYKNYFVFCTDPVSSLLRDLALDFSIDCLPVPSNVGGRFSVLTPVGIFPALFANIPVQDFFKAYPLCKKNLFEGEKQLATLSSFILNLKSEGVTQTVFMPYSSLLRSFSNWFIQLWAESLGKKLDNKGKICHQGLTPIASYGATDQHSQVQLFMEGPHDKLIILIKVAKFKTDFSLDSGHHQKLFTKLNHVSLSQLMQAELEGTIKALDLAKRPYALVEIEELSAESLGALILFFESLTNMVGAQLEINPFDQPGVEAGKIFANDWLAQLKKC
jgi:glucose-6-phosphate isomerase